MPFLSYHLVDFWVRSRFIYFLLVVVVIQTFELTIEML